MGLTRKMAELEIRGDQYQFLVHGLSIARRVEQFRPSR